MRRHDRRLARGPVRDRVLVDPEAARDIPGLQAAPLEKLPELAVRHAILRVTTDWDPGSGSVPTDWYSSAVHGPTSQIAVPGGELWPARPIKGVINVPRVGSAAVVRSGNALLLARRAKEPNIGRWVFPGGKVEPFESIRAAAARELLEETGLHVNVGEQIGAFEIIEPPNEHRVIIYSWAEPVGGTLRAESDVTDLRFCTREEISELDLSDIVARVARSIGWLDDSTRLAA